MVTPKKKLPENQVKAPLMERYVDIIPYPDPKKPQHFLLYLHVGNHRFRIQYEAHTLNEANLAKDTLCVALDQIVNESKVMNPAT